MLIETYISAQEYFDLLLKSDIKLEYHDGEVVAMAGAQPAHNRVSSRLIFLLERCLEQSGCMVFNSDQLIKVEECRKFTFPDVVIVCQEPIFYKSPNGLDALENPEIIIEVLSDSTELYDRTGKFECYKTILSLNEYILVSTNTKKVEKFKRINEDEWIERTFTEKDKKIKIGNCEIDLDEIYWKVPSISS
jgi:Uma2 family endonuclease